MEFKLTKKSLPTLLQEAGVPGEMRYVDEQGGRMMYFVGDERMTPGEAAQRYLPACDTCGKVWPRCSHV